MIHTSYSYTWRIESCCRDVQFFNIGFSDDLGAKNVPDKLRTCNFVQSAIFVKLVAVKTYYIQQKYLFVRTSHLLISKLTKFGPQTSRNFFSVSSSIIKLNDEENRF